VLAAEAVVTFVLVLVVVAVATDTRVPRLGETERAEQALAGLGGQGREHGEARIAAAAPRLAQDDPCAATAAPRTGPGGRPSSRQLADLADDRFCRCQVCLRTRCPGRARVICVAAQDVWLPVPR
jgi:hypothetical protein